MNTHPEANSQNSTIADQLDALFAESKKLAVEWSKIYHTASGRPRTRFTPSQDAALRENGKRSNEVTAKILALMEEAAK